MSLRPSLGRLESLSLLQLHVAHHASAVPKRKSLWLLLHLFAALRSPLPLHLQQLQLLSLPLLLHQRDVVDGQVQEQHLLLERRVLHRQQQQHCQCCPLFSLRFLVVQEQQQQQQEEASHVLTFRSCFKASEIPPSSHSVDLSLPLLPLRRLLQL